VLRMGMLADVNISGYLRVVADALAVTPGACLSGDVVSLRLAQEHAHRGEYLAFRNSYLMESRRSTSTVTPHAFGYRF
jgi:hypothetical protein